MNEFRLINRRRALKNDYINKANEYKKPIKNKNENYINKLFTHSITTDKREIIKKQLNDDIKDYKTMINELKEKSKVINPILVEIKCKLNNYGFTESRANNIIEEVDKIIEKYLNNEFINIINEIQNSLFSEILSFTYRELKDYYEFKKNIPFRL